MISFRSLRRSGLFPVFALTLVLAGALYQAPGTQKSPGETVTEEGYWELIDDSLDIVQQVRSGASEVAAQDLLNLADHWEPISDVRRVDGSLSPLDNSFLVAKLRAPEPDLAQIESLLLTLSAANQNWPEPSFEEQDLASLKAILARPEFQWPEEEPSPLERVWQQVRESILALLARLIPAEVAGGSFLRTFLTVIGVVVLAIALLYATRGLLADFAAEVEGVSAGELGEELLTSESAFRQAQTLSGTGDYRSAVRYLYLSSLLILDERNLLRYDRSLTNREYLGSIIDRPELAITLREVTDVFDHVWYGFQPLDEEAYNLYVAQVNELRHRR
jgi:hypothetical protein